MPQSQLYHAAAALAAALGLAAPPANAQVRSRAASDYSYEFQLADHGDGAGQTGTVRVHGDRTRIDMERSGSEREYVLVLDHGQRMLVVRPAKKEIQEMATPDFERIAGTALRAASVAVNVRLANSDIAARSLGRGEDLLGYRTEHVRATERFDATIGALGFDAGTEHHTVITDYWIAPDLALVENPVVNVVMASETALAQTDADFVRRAAAMRANVLHGAPLRTVVTSSEAKSDADRTAPGAAQRFEITRLSIEPQSPSLFDVPAGYATSTSRLRLDRW